MAIDGTTPSAIPDGSQSDEKGRKLWPYDQYWENLAVWNFLDLSIEGGSAYKTGRDSEGEEIFQQHKKEDISDAKKRRQRSSVLNYCDFFAARFHGYATGKKPARVEAADLSWRMFLEDATGAGETWPEFMERAQRTALELSPAWIGIDAPSVEPGRYQSLQDQIDLGVRPYVYQIDPRNVVDVEWAGGVLRRIVIREDQRIKHSSMDVEAQSVTFLEWWPDMWVRWRAIGDDAMGHFVVEKQPLATGENPWGFIPFVPLHFGRPGRTLPVFSRSMIHDCATLQRDLFRLKSLYFEELFNRTFSTMVLAGTTGDEIGTQLNQTLLVLEDPEARVAAAGADTQQAESLLEGIKWLIRNMFRVAQFESSGDPMEVATRSAESGKKKARDLEGLYQVLSRFSSATEKVENRVLQMWEKISGKKVGAFARTSYAVDYNIQATAELIDELQSLELSEFPATFVSEIRSGIMRRMRPQLTDEMWTRIEQEVARAAANDLEDIVEQAMNETSAA